MRKTIKKKLELNKVTISKLDNIELGLALAGFCPPVSLNHEDTCVASNCPTTLIDPGKNESTAGC